MREGWERRKREGGEGGKAEAFLKARQRVSKIDKEWCESRPSFEGTKMKE